MDVSFRGRSGNLLLVLGLTALTPKATFAEPKSRNAAKFHGGSNHAANAAWHRAIKAEGLELINGKLDNTP
jgi:hypothetical protein